MDIGPQADVRFKFEGIILKSKEGNFPKLSNEKYSAYR